MRRPWDRWKAESPPHDAVLSPKARQMRLIVDWLNAVLAANLRLDHRVALLGVFSSVICTTRSTFSSPISRGLPDAVHRPVRQLLR